MAVSRINRTLMTTVTVIIPTYNRSNCLPRAIDSVLEQTIADFELIVVDDGSTDDTRAVVTEYDDQRVSYIAHERNRGQTAAFNTGLEAADGEYVAFLDSDDELSPTFLETTIRAVRTEPNDCAGSCVTLQAHYDHADKDDELLPVPSIMNGMDSIDSEIPRTGGLLLRANAVDSIGRFDEEISYNNDVDYWIRLFQNGYYLIGISEPLYHYYIHGEQQTRNTDARLDGLTAFLEKHDATLRPSHRAKLYRDLGMAHVQNGDFTIASRQFRRALEDSSGASMNYWYYLTARACPRLLPVGKRAKRIVVEMRRRSRLS